MPCGPSSDSWWATAILMCCHTVAVRVLSANRTRSRNTLVSRLPSPYSAAPSMSQKSRSLDLIEKSGLQNAVVPYGSSASRAGPAGCCMTA